MKRPEWKESDYAVLFQNLLFGVLHGGVLIDATAAEIGRSPTAILAKLTRLGVAYDMGRDEEGGCVAHPQG